MWVFLPDQGIGIMQTHAAISAMLLHALPAKQASRSATSHAPPTKVRPLAFATADAVPAAPLLLKSGAPTRAEAAAATCQGTVHAAVVATVRSPAIPVPRGSCRRKQAAATAALPVAVVGAET